MNAINLESSLKEAEESLEYLMSQSNPTDRETHGALIDEQNDLIKYIHIVGKYLQCS